MDEEVISNQRGGFEDMHAKDIGRCRGARKASFCVNDYLTLIGLGHQRRYELDLVMKLNRVYNLHACWGCIGSINTGNAPPVLCLISFYLKLVVGDENGSKHTN